jgi:hypothetical protein
MLFDLRRVQIGEVPLALAEAPAAEDESPGLHPLDGLADGLLGNRSPRRPSWRPPAAPCTGPGRVPGKELREAEENFGRRLEVAGGGGGSQRRKGFARGGRRRQERGSRAPKTSNLAL